MNAQTKHFYDNLRWTNGAGNGTRTACVNSLAVLMDAERRGLSREDALAEFSDNAECICPVVRRLSIRINDRAAFWPDADEATAWMHATASRLLDTRGSDELARVRAYLCADAAVREIAPVAFDRLAKIKPEFAGWAAKLRACEPVTDKQRALAARAVANDAKKAADAAADADAYAYAAAYAAAYAYAAADAAAYAYANAAAAKITKPILLALLDRLIAAQVQA